GPAGPPRVVGGGDQSRRRSGQTGARDRPRTPHRPEGWYLAQRAPASGGIARATAAEPHNHSRRRARLKPSIARIQQTGEHSMMKIEGASAIVTGGASGLGAATVRSLAERGMKVVV